MNILIYAGSIRPGGGLTVLKLVLQELSRDTENHITVYTGEEDASAQLQDLIGNSSNIEEKRFLGRATATVRYAISKFFFLYESLVTKTDILFTFNYFVPAACKVVIYHINLLHFQREVSGQAPSISEKVKDIDARLACRLAASNWFESEYLLEQAKQRLKGRISRMKLLHIGVDPDFYLEKDSILPRKDAERVVNILLVSSMQPHKDNFTCIEALQSLKKIDNSIHWRLQVVGGQSVEQWEPLRDKAKAVGVSDSLLLLGPLSKKKIAILMSQALCLVSSSRVESFCMVALEAMAAGCPVVAANATSMPESIGEAGVLVEPGDAEGFASAIYELFEHGSHRAELINRGHRRAEDFSVAVFGRKARDYIREK